MSQARIASLYLFFNKNDRMPYFDIQCSMFGIPYSYSLSLKRGTSKMI